MASFCCPRERGCPIHDPRCHKILVSKSVTALDTWLGACKSGGAQGGCRGPPRPASAGISFMTWVEAVGPPEGQGRQEGRKG